MVSYTDIWKLIAGIGVFLFAMQLLESALKQLAGRSFKLFLRKHTTNRVKAIFSGALLTGILQSSSVVTFIMLAFLGAGIVSMRNTLAVVLGANFGTSLGNWIIATLGFKFDIEVFAYPAIGLGGIALLLFSDRKKVVSFCRFAIGFGLLFIGLAYMKNSIAGLVENYDMRQLAGYPLVVFLLAGIVITAIIQSSTATTILVLSALTANAIDLVTAAAVVTGAEVGTTLKIMLTGLGGSAAKKRVATGNLIFNVVVVIISFVFLRWLVQFITTSMGISDPLIAIVMFQSIINLGTILLFFPLLDPFTRFLEKRFSDSHDSIALHIVKVSPEVPEAALKALEKEARHFVQRAIDLNLHTFRIEDVPVPGITNHRRRMEPEKMYEELKQLHGEIMAFYSGMRQQELRGNEAGLAEQLAGSVRNAMYSAKCMKDISHNVEELSGSGNDFKYKWFLHTREKLGEFYHYSVSLLGEHNNEAEKKIEAGMNEIRKYYDTFLDTIYKDGARGKVNEMELSTLVNVNREIFSSCKALLLSLQDLIRETTAPAAVLPVPAT